jgi:hypothetical protein
MKLFQFLPGKISSFQGRFYDYREGETWSYRIEHPQARILIDQGSHLHSGKPLSPAILIIF